MKTEIVISAVSDITEISLDEMTSRDRHRDTTEARHIAMYILRMKKNLPLKKIGNIFNRDHTSVIHAVRLAGDLIITSESFKTKFDLILEMIEERTTGYNLNTLQKQKPSPYIYPGLRRLTPKQTL